MKPRPFDDRLLEELVREHGTPLYVYDVDRVRARIEELLPIDRTDGVAPQREAGPPEAHGRRSAGASKASSASCAAQVSGSRASDSAQGSSSSGRRAAEGSSSSDRRGFDVVRYAQKANSNVALLERMRAFGVAVDAVSAGEIVRALRAGFVPEEIVFTSDVFDRPTLALLAEHPVPVNLGSPDMVEQYARLARSGMSPRRITLRINPGFGHGHGHKVSTGGEQSKHGIWHEHLPAVAARARSLGLEIGGLHVHIGSGSDFENLARAALAVRRLASHVGASLATISSGGGLPIPYRDGEPRFDVARFVATWAETRTAIERDLGREITLEVEPGRYLVAEAGVLLTEVRGTKTSGGFDYVLVDAGFHNLVRPAMYGAFHQISVVGHGPDEPGEPKVVAGPLCESADVFTQGHGGELEPQHLPVVRAGDLLCIHDAGAYAASMASNYNSQPLAAEVLVEGGVARLVRRRQTIDEMLAGE